MTSRKDGKLKVKFDNDDTKKFRLIKECDLQLYEGVASSPNCKSQTEEESFEYILNNLLNFINHF